MFTKLHITIDLSLIMLNHLNRPVRTFVTVCFFYVHVSKQQTVSCYFKLCPCLQYQTNFMNLKFGIILSIYGAGQIDDG